MAVPDRKANGHGPSKHVEGCVCVRCTGFPKNNTLSVRHGAQSERQIVRRATVEKRRLLRQIGLRQDDLGSVGRALLLNWSRGPATPMGSAPSISPSSGFADAALALEN